MKTIFLLAFLLSLTTNAALPAKDCEASPDGIMRAYNAVVANQQVSEQLQCLLSLHQSGSGLVKILAADALRPLLGGRALAGRSLDAKVRSAFDKLHQEALKAPDVVHESFLTEFTRGTWGFYDLFCKPQTPEACVLFLPDENQVQKESALIGSSSMILLRTAYLGLKGPEQKQVESRLRNLYQRISKNEPLKRKVIDQIYQELFGVKVPLA